MVVQHLDRLHGVGRRIPELGTARPDRGRSRLPQAGDYDAVISDVRLIDKSDRLWMIVDFNLVGLEASPAPMWALLASHNGHSDDHRLAEGARVVRRLAAAILTPLEAIKDSFELPGLFLGKPVNLTVVHKERDGVKELVVRSIRQR